MTPVSEVSKVRDVFLNSIRALAEALEAKDPYTAGQSKRVTEYSVEIALADSIDAMSSVRPYRPGLTSAEVAEELRKNSGTQFDPELVDAFFRTIYGKELLRSARETPMLFATAAETPAPAGGAGAPEAASGAAANSAAGAEPIIEAPTEPLVTRRKVLDAIHCRTDVKALSSVTAEILRLTSRPDVVVMRTADESAVAANLRELSELSLTGAVGAVKVLLLGKNSPKGDVSSAYPAEMTAFVAEPYSTAAVERSLQTLLAK